MEFSTKTAQASDQWATNLGRDLQTWTQICEVLSLDLEGSARQTRALLRRREIQTAGDLLRLALMYALSDYSLRQLGVWAQQHGIGYLSDVAILKRLRHCHVWLGRLLGELLVQRSQAWQGLNGVRVCFQDASTLSRPGATGTDYRLHLTLNLDPLAIQGIEITDQHGAESLARFAPDPQAIRVADRGYAYVKSLLPLLLANSPFVVRANWQNLPLKTECGERFALINWLQTLSAPGEQVVWLPTTEDSFPVRLLACPLPPEALEEARRRAYERNAKKGCTPSQETLLAAGFLILITNLPAATWPVELAAGLYRLRWQIELVFKRLKSQLHLDHLRMQDPQMVQVYLYAKLLLYLIIEGLIHQVELWQPEWFLSLKRPVSIWRLTENFRDHLRQVVYGRLDLSHFWACLGALRRYLCDSPRARPQQLAVARLFIRCAKGVLAVV